jgi:hypothetical protein
MYRCGMRGLTLTLQSDAQQGQGALVIRLRIKQTAAILLSLHCVTLTQQQHDVFDVTLLNGQTITPALVEETASGSHAGLIIASRPF